MRRRSLLAARFVIDNKETAMSRIVKCGIIQLANQLDTDASCEEHRKAMIEAHIPYIEEAGNQGVQML